MIELIDDRPLTRIQTLHVLPSFLESAQRWQGDRTLRPALSTTLDRLQSGMPAQRLRLEFLARIEGRRIFAVQIAMRYRLLFCEFRQGEIGLLYLDTNDSAIAWLRHERALVGEMVQRLPAAPSRKPLRAPPPFPRPDHTSLLTIPNAGALMQMFDRGIGRYGARLDEGQAQAADPTRETAQPALVEAPAGSGKTAAGLARIALAARQTDVEYGPALYLCESAALADTAAEALGVPRGAAANRATIEVCTVAEWCERYLSNRSRLPALTGASGWLESRARTALERNPELRAQAGGISGQDLAAEIRRVFRPNGLNTVQDYLAIDRPADLVDLTDAQRVAVWALAARVRELTHGQFELSDLPVLAEAVLTGDRRLFPYRTVVLDELENLSPVVVRIAKMLVNSDPRRLLGLADPAQSVDPARYAWTRRSFGDAPLTVQRLTGMYAGGAAAAWRTMAARPRLSGGGLLLHTGSQTPKVVTHSSFEDELRWLTAEIRADLYGDENRRTWNPEQIAVLTPNERMLNRVAGALQGIAPLPAAQGTAYRLDSLELTVKLLTYYGARGFHFPVVYALGMTRTDFGPSDRAPDPQGLFATVLSRAGDRLTLSTLLGEQHPLLEPLLSRRPARV